MSAVGRLPKLEESLNFVLPSGEERLKSGAAAPTVSPPGEGLSRWPTTPRLPMSNAIASRYSLFIRAMVFDDLSARKFTAVTMQHIHQVLSRQVTGCTRRQRTSPQPTGRRDIEAVGHRQVFPVMLSMFSRTMGLQLGAIAAAVELRLRGSNPHRDLRSWTVRVHSCTRRGRQDRPRSHIAFHCSQSSGQKTKCDHRRIS